MSAKRFLQIILVWLFSILYVLGQNTIGVIENSAEAFDGYTLFTVHNETYLINNCGELVNQWTSRYSAGHSVYLLENGQLLRAAEIPNPGEIIVPGIGGRIELFDWEGAVVWECEYSTDKASQHHEVYPMPNGNVLVLAATILDQDEAQKLGRKQLTPPAFQLYNEQIIELKPLGTGDAEIVWEWNIKDHLIQDFDKTRDNYGDISQTPNRLDINFLGTTGGGANWLHFNSLQYNADLDQIILSSRHTSEIYIIDHSTTIAEAAMDLGGRYGKGGDILYRWGNPMAYQQGTKEDQQLYGPHAPHWIKAGYPAAGKILLFNNGTQRLPEYSEVFILDPPVNEPGHYVYESNTAYGPLTPIRTFSEINKKVFYSPFLSNAQMLQNGNLLLCVGDKGHFIEIDSTERIVWKYINPVGSSSVMAQGDDPVASGNKVFRAKKYPKDYPAFECRDLTPGLTIESGQSMALRLNCH